MSPRSYSARAFDSAFLSSALSDTQQRVLAIREAVYDGHVDTPKTKASRRDLPLSPHALRLFADWRAQAKRTGDDDLVFATRSGLPISPNNVLRRWVYPACNDLGLPRSSWLTCRRTYTRHDRGVPHKVLAELLGHANVYTTLNVYTQSVAGAKRAAAATIGDELFRIVQKPERAQT